MKLLKNVFVFALCILLLASCANVEDEVSETWLEGIEQGRQDMFLELWQAADLLNILNCNEAWETDYFSLIFSHNTTEEGVFLTFDLTLNNLSIQKCFEEKKMFFNIYSNSISNRNWDMVLGYDYYFDYALLGHLDGHNGKGTIGLCDTPDSLAIIIVIDGCLFTATYIL